MLELRTWITTASDRLEKAGNPTPRFDAERIAAHVYGLTWSELWTKMIGRTIDADRTAELDEVLRRRMDGEPLAYIEGSRVFFGLELECGPGVLVPRPETEVLVEVGLELIADVTSPLVVDIGTGAGGVALAIASKRPDARIVASDVSEDALAFARRNADAHRLDVGFAQGDLYDAFDPALRGRIDLIVSNPPYVPDGAGVDPDVRAEPKVAIFGGEIGTDITQRLVEGASQWLRPGGALAFEFGQPYQSWTLPEARLRNDSNDRPRVAWRRF